MEVWQVVLTAIGGIIIGWLASDIRWKYIKGVTDRLRGGSAEEPKHLLTDDAKHSLCYVIPITIALVIIVYFICQYNIAERRERYKAVAQGFEFIKCREGEHVVRLDKHSFRREE